MKYICLLTAIFLIVLMNSFVTDVVNAAILFVDDDSAECPTAGNTTINGAIAAASSGDTIIVCPGTYNEHVLIDKSLTLKSQTGIPSTTKIIGLGGSNLGNSYVIQIRGGLSSVTVEGFDVSNPDYVGLNSDNVGILSSSGSTDITIRNNVIHNVRKTGFPDCLPLFSSGIPVGSFAIGLNGVGDALIEDNVIFDIINSGCSPDSRFRKMSRGIFVSGTASGKIIIRNNNITKLQGFNPTGINVVRSGNFEISGNEVSELTATDIALDGGTPNKFGIYVSDFTGGSEEVLSNTISDVEVGVYLESITGVNVESNTLTGITAFNGVFQAAFENTFCNNNLDTTAGFLVFFGSTLNTFPFGNTFTLDVFFNIVPGGETGNFDCIITPPCPIACGKKGNKVLICHVPPENPADAHNICISPNAADAHLANHPGDDLCPCPSGKWVNDFMLLEAYPNPLSNITIIEFSVPEAGKVTLDVFSITGAKVASLFNGMAESNEVYTIELRAEELLTGTYLYKLITETTSVIRKLVIIK